MKEWSRISLYIFLVPMLCLFTIQSWQCYIKYSSNAILQMELQDYRETLEVPAITICPKGTKGGGPIAPNYETLLREFCKDMPEDEFFACWQDLFFDLDDIFVHASFENDTADYDLTNYTQVTRIFTPSHFHFTCWIISIKFEIPTGTGIDGSRLKIGVKPNTDYILYVHDHQVAPVNMQAPKHIPISFSQLDWVNKNYTVTVYTLEKKIISKIPNELCENSPKYSFFECFKDAIFRKTGCKLDTWPLKQLDKNATLCSNATSLISYGADLSMDMMFGTMKTIYEITQCKPQCVVAKYEVEKYHLASDIKYGDGIGDNYILFVYKNGDVTIVAETPFYDINNFVGEVGGSLGFFLGASLVSLYYAGKNIFNHVLNKIYIVKK